MVKRGRPKELPELPPKRKFTRTYHRKDGTISYWKFDLDKHPNGPISVNVEYPKNYFPEIPMVLNEDDPITKRLFWNGKSDKYVGYQRAKQLGIVDKVYGKTKS